MDAPFTRALHTDGCGHGSRHLLQVDVGEGAAARLARQH